MLVPSLHPLSVEEWHALFFHLRQFFCQLVVFQLPPTVHHFGHVLGLVTKTGIILHSVRLGAGDKSMLGIVEHQMSNVRVRTEDSIESLGAGGTRHGKITANFVCEGVRLVVDLLFRNCEELAKVTLNSRLHRTVTLDGLQMPYTQDDQGGRRQDYSQLQNQHHPGSRAGWAFRFHPGLLIRAFTWISPA